ncbi:MAG: iron dependent repressor, metal binding and dimerization domain protein [Candidatus Caldarchaeales archaeon]
MEGGAGREAAILQQIRRVRRSKRRPQPDVEDYLEVIYALERVKGYATSSDVASHLNVKLPAVTKMLKRLHELGYITYERYRGFVLTESGRRLASEVLHRHDVLVELLKVLGIPEEVAEAEAEYLEHGLSALTLKRLVEVLELFRGRPELLRELSTR